MQHLGLKDVDVKDPETIQTVTVDDKSLGEIMFRGNPVISGYLKDIKATEQAFRGGRFRSEDLAVKHSVGVKQFCMVTQQFSWLQSLAAQMIIGDKHLVHL
ncbi:hypothetical protein HS088_TW18G00611 [Tripterygium wilfordii]|uniref:Uncharacterized protein n=1 Tax=Tripterygium wilfordii TaxID=458696 RepID=A0A7J7CCM7_TRIWF|nr:hypothetical protein HS088_TW18G00611 [Tripterygium wilfordii]